MADLSADLDQLGEAYGRLKMVGDHIEEILVNLRPQRATLDQLRQEYFYQVNELFSIAYNLENGVDHVIHPYHVDIFHADVLRRSIFQRLDQNESDLDQMIGQLEIASQQIATKCTQLGAIIVKFVELHGLIGERIALIAPILASMLFDKPSNKADYHGSKQSNFALNFNSLQFAPGIPMPDKMKDDIRDQLNTDPGNWQEAPPTAGMTQQQKDALYDIECVAFVQIAYRALGIKMPSFNGNAYQAVDTFDNNPDWQVIHVDRPQDIQPGVTWGTPQVGDMIVFNEKFKGQGGHVAIVTKVTGTTVEFYQSHSSSLHASISYDPVKHVADGYYGMPLRGFIHYQGKIDPANQQDFSNAVDALLKQP